MLYLCHIFIHLYIFNSLLILNILLTCLFGVECGSVIAGLKPLVESFRLQQGNSFELMPISNWSLQTFKRFGRFVHTHLFGLINKQNGVLRRPHP